ncbi:putative glycoside hydrolase [Pseudonocardia acaciae]|uniref:putative glycoside hydrolase n=1 Tax=Pseudonocardia acaciae TaxID=551276 RepID=UPI000687C4B8|nr:putative glycoside hydrolase [Pseudonocardia acaciae]
MLSTRRRLAVAAAVLAALWPLPGTTPTTPAGPVAGVAAMAPVGAFWYGIGAAPAPADVTAAAAEGGVVVLNAWETATLRRLRRLNPSLVVLVYKDLSSTRGYPGAVRDGADAPTLPAGVGYVAATRSHPEWFALDNQGRRIEWNGYPGHWQMAVWDPGYQAAWVDAVTAEVVREGWDGVLADNDLARLRTYSPAVLAGMRTAARGDQLLRDGLDALVTRAGQALTAAGKLLVPNVGEARLFPGRWREHARFGGAMEENFVVWPDGRFVTDTEAGDWTTQTDQTTDPGPLALLVTQSTDPRARRYGYASALVRTGGRAHWTAADRGDYRRRTAPPPLGLALGAPAGPPTRSPDGLWTREFQGGWVAVNPTDRPLTAHPPPGTEPAEPVTVPPADAVLLALGARR